MKYTVTMGHLNGANSSIDIYAESKREAMIQAQQDYCVGSGWYALNAEQACVIPH